VLKKTGTVHKINPKSLLSMIKG